MSQAPVPCGDSAALVAAVAAANGEPSGGTVVLATGCGYTLGSAAATGANGPDGLPIISGDVTITGTQATIRRSASATDFRIAEVAAGGKLTVKGVTLSDGRATSGAGTDGGGILDLGTLRLISPRSPATPRATSAAASRSPREPRRFSRPPM
ncbi:hypothetical protein [Streptomyces sp. NPDC005336]|uniref:hypothetical protein n=1 Tax=unclassified Streptomyces TaxID=2593676 RepID=UPI0033A10407